MGAKCVFIFSTLTDTSVFFCCSCFGKKYQYAKWAWSWIENSFESLLTNRIIGNFDSGKICLWAVRSIFVIGSHSLASYILQYSSHNATSIYIYLRPMLYRLQNCSRHFCCQACYCHKSGGQLFLHQLVLFSP